MRVLKASPRVGHWLVIAALLALSFLQRPGRITFDTKFDLTADPGAFLGRTLRLWNPQLSFGELQNQAYGYLFPQGTFFWLGDLSGTPDWVVQRLWSGLVLIVAYAGARRLFIALRADSPPWAPTLAGLAFALSPRLLGLAGVLSAEVLPTAVLPWVVLPLVLALGGRLSPRTGALLSGAAVLLMGGVNAVENVAALPLPALVIAFSLGTPLGRRLALWWVGAVALASAWWMLPILVLGKYSPPFLDYIETAAATTFPLGWTNVVRGADHWVGFISAGGRPWWPGAYQLSVDPWLIAITSLVATVSLAGLFHPRMPLRVPLVVSTVVGMALLTLAHASPLASPLSGPVRDLLDGPLAMLRNVHKVDPLVRLPLALGLGHAAVLLAGRLGRLRRPEQVARWSAQVSVGLLGVLLVLSAQPMFTGDLRKQGWEKIPQAWQDTADYLAEHSRGRRALVLPGSGFGQQSWGWTIDEPIQGLASSPWATRSQVPLVPGPTIRFLDSLQDRIQDGRGSRALADALARSGIGYVVVRRDLDLYASSAPTPQRVDQALARSPDFARVASFGASEVGGEAMIDILTVQRPVAVVEAVETAEVLRLSGEPGDVLTALESRLLDSDRPVVIGTEAGEPPDLVTDGYRRRERQFGRLADSISQTMTANEPYRLQRKAHDYPGVPGVPRVRARYVDLETVLASSSSGYADTLGPVRPELGPFSAVDGISATYWRSAPLEAPVGQWVELRLNEPRPLSHVDLELGVDPFSGVPIREVRVEAGDQQVDVAVDPVSGEVRAPLSGALVDSVRVTVLRTRGNPDTGVVAIREISLPGLTPGRFMEVPDVGATGATSFVFRAPPLRQACVESSLGISCNTDESRTAEEEAGIYRTFTTADVGLWRVRGTVTPRATPETAALLAPLGGAVRVEASSVLADDPAVSGQFAHDGDASTPWLSQPGDLRPALRLTWDKPRRLSRIQVTAAQGPSRTPTTAILEAAGGQRREVSLGAGSLGYFAPFRTRSVLVSFPMTEQPEGFDALPIGIGDLDITGLRSLRYEPDRAARTGATCGLGPEVRVDGVTRRTRVLGHLGDVIDGNPMKLKTCGASVRLPSGEHDLSVESTDRFSPTILTFRSQLGVRATSPVHRRDVQILEWGPTHRRVTVAAGDEALLRVAENANPGWRATLDGEVLETMPVDGWQQGYVVPAGAGGEVVLEYTPDGIYRFFLLLGALCAGLLLVALGLSLRRDRGRVPTPLLLPAPMTAAVPRGRWTLLLFAGGLLLLGGVGVAVGAVVGFLLAARTRWSAGLLLVATTGVGAGVLAQLEQRAPWDALDALASVAVGLLASTLIEKGRGR